ncbi:MAG: hypothetical protein ACRDWS_03875 [Acidimicrobiia bacterium]
MSHSAAATAIALLVVVACGGDAESSTTSGSSSTTTSTSVPGTSLSTQAGSTTQVTTTLDGTGTTQGSPDTLPPIIAQVGFAFATGADPSMLVEVSVGESPDGPWSPAGFGDPLPTLSGPRFWVRFSITNVDELGAVLTDLDISGFDAGSFLGQDICHLDSPIPPGGEQTCIVGGADGFPVQPGPNQNDFTADGVGDRQGAPDRWFAPQIPTALGFAGARNSFLLVFDTPEGARFDGTADASEVVIDIGGLGLSHPLKVDCSDQFPDGRSATGGSPTTGEPALAAYVIENYSAAGDPGGGCTHVPTEQLAFDLDGNSDTAFLYEGVVADATSTSTGG